jgi:hypothetical protein
MGTFAAKIAGLKCSFHWSVRLVLSATVWLPKLVKSGAEYCEKARHVKL